MRYYKILDANGWVTEIGAGDGLDGVAITEAEYNSLLAEIEVKADYIDRLYRGEIIIDDVPAAWQDEIQAAVDERIETEGVYDAQQISDEDALAIIKGAIE